ncbi:hypothetical protein B484DRAFT_234827, partial [Ochromonadaceae sp. CCMP2298]
ESRAFLSTLERGQVPPELIREGSIDLDVNLVDSRTTDYVVPPPPAYVAFSGGATLGASAASEAFVFSPEVLSGVQAPAVDEAQPSTTLQVKTTSGKKIRIKLNKSATVLQLAAVIVRDAGGAEDSFVLSAGFPPVDVLDGSVTLEQAQLVGAAVSQRKV